LDRLYLIFRLTWTIENSKATTKYRAAAAKEAAAIRLRRPRHRDAWTKVSLRRLERAFRRRTQRAVRDIKQDLQVSILSQWSVVLISQSIVEREVWSDLPLVFSVSNVVLLFRKSLSGRAVIERTRRTQVAEKLDRLRRVCQEAIQV